MFNINSQTPRSHLQPETLPMFIDWSIQDPESTESSPDWHCVCVDERLPQWDSFCTRLSRWGAESRETLELIDPLSFPEPNRSQESPALYIWASCGCRFSWQLLLFLIGEAINLSCAPSVTVYSDRSLWYQRQCSWWVRVQVCLVLRTRMKAWLLKRLLCPQSK